MLPGIVLSRKKSSVWFKKKPRQPVHGTFHESSAHLRPNDNLSLVKEQQKERRFELGFETICPNWEKWFRNPTTTALLIYDPTTVSARGVLGVDPVSFLGIQPWRLALPPQLPLPLRR